MFPNFVILKFNTKIIVIVISILNVNNSAFINCDINENINKC